MVPSFLARPFAWLVVPLLLVCAPAGAALDENGVTDGGAGGGLDAIVREDAEDRSTDRWRLVDPTPAGAMIANVVDPLGGEDASGARVPGRAIELTGTDRQNAFLIGNGDARAPGWNERERTFLRWRMQADSPVNVYVRLETADGTRDLVYTASARSAGPNGANTVLYHGLGPAAIDGDWHRWTRDLAADLAAFQPGNTLIAVHGVFVRGSGRFDDIEMLDLGDGAVAPVAATPPVASVATPPPEASDVGDGDDPSAVGGGDDGGAGGSGAGVAAGGAGGAPIADADRDAARLLAQASFGATDAEIARVRELGVAGWIDDQLGRRGPAHLDYVRANSNGSSREARHDIWWRDAITGEDQLRQRVAFALSQIFVVADTGYTLGNAQYGITGYYDVLRDGAFGSYRELLEKVTLHPVMGIYLSMLQNDKGDPEGNTRADENFAREVLQLFSIGPHVLRADGSRPTVDGAPVPVYTQSEVEAYARAFTGWNFAGAVRWDLPMIRTDADKVRPMEPNEDHHDTGSKTLLGGVVTPTGATARQDLEIALDTIADHPNVGPFIASALIQRLVTSNPTPAYVRRAAAVFDDDGRGARGNLGALVRAILLDPEARAGHESVVDFGKLREPVLRIGHLWRAFGARPGTRSVDGNFNTNSPHAKDLDTITGQAVLKSPSVFNFYRPDHAPLGEIRDGDRVAPEAEIYTDGHILATTTRLNSHVQRYHDLGDANSLKSTFIDLSTERALLASGGADALLRRLDLLLLSGGMDEALRAILREHVAAFPATEAGRSQAVRDAITLIMASPAYLVQS